MAVALPFPVYEDQVISDFSLSSSDGKTEKAALLADFDSIFTTDLRNRYPAIVIRSLLSAAAKSMADYVAREELGVAGTIGGLILQATTIADTRSWTTLPKQILVARIPTPDDRKVSIRSGAGDPVEVVLGPGRIHALLIRVPSSRSGIVSVHHFRVDDPLFSSTP